jgi:hypothetical protein
MIFWEGWAWRLASWAAQVKYWEWKVTSLASKSEKNWSKERRLVAEEEEGRRRRESQRGRGTHHRPISRSDLDTDGEHLRKGKVRGVLSDEFENGGFGTKEVVDQAGVGGLHPQSEFVETWRERIVPEGTDDNAAIDVELRGRKIGSVVIGERGRTSNKEVENV